MKPHKIEFWSRGPGVAMLTYLEMSIDISDSWCKAQGPATVLRYNAALASAATAAFNDSKIVSEEE